MNYFIGIIDVHFKILIEAIIIEFAKIDTVKKMKQQFVDKKCLFYRINFVIFHNPFALLS